MTGSVKKIVDYVTSYDDNGNNENEFYICLRWTHTFTQSSIGIWVAIVGTYVWYINNVKSTNRNEQQVQENTVNQDTNLDNNHNGTINNTDYYNNGDGDDDDYDGYDQTVMLKTNDQQKKDTELKLEEKELQGMENEDGNESIQLQPVKVC